MPPLDLIAPLDMEASIGHANLMDFDITHGIIVTFAMILLFKYKFFDWWFNKVILKTKYQDVCYFCFCFWLSMIFLILGFGVKDVIVSTIISRYLFIQIIGI